MPPGILPNRTINPFQLLTKTDLNNLIYQPVHVNLLSASLYYLQQMVMNEVCNELTH